MAYGTTASSSSERVQAQWWKAEKGRVHEILGPLVRRLRMQDERRRSETLRHLRMYGNYSRSGYLAANGVVLPEDRLRYNLCSQGVDALVAEVTASKPKASFIADGGDWTLRQAAKACEQLIEAQMREQGIYDGLAREIFRDACTTGTGVLYGYLDPLRAKACCERVLPLELLVDEADARYRRPRGIYRVKPCDRAVMREKHGKTAALRDAIDKAPAFIPYGDEQWLMPDASESDLILVIEAWHLPSGPKAKDGKRVCAIENADLYEYAYEHECFPFEVLRFEDPPVGFWGVGVVERLRPDQIELNRVLRRIQEAGAAAAGHWLIERGAKVRKANLTDLAGAALEYSGAIPPQYVVPPTMPGDLIQHADRIIERALSRLGISEMFATSQKPAGLNSGEAIRTHSDLYSRRQIERAQAYESWHVAVARMFVRLNDELAELVDGKSENGELSVPVEVKRGRRTVLKRLRWDEVKSPENAYVIKAYPMSSLPSEPSGRQARITEWIQGGLINTEQAKFLLDMPDLEGQVNLDLADHDYALYAYEIMVEDGKYCPPEPYQRLDLALELMRRSYLRGRIDEVPENRLDLVRDHMVAIEQLMDKLAREQAAKAAGMGMGQVDAGAVPAGAAPEQAAVGESTPIGMAA